VIQRILENCAT